MEAYITSGGLPDIYRCEQVNRTQEEWWALGKKVPLLGAISLAWGIISIFLYCLCISALLQKELQQTVAYKILLLLCCFDIIGLIPNSVLSGVFFIQGAVYCNYPNFFYIWGSVVLGTFSQDA